MDRTQHGDPAPAASRPPLGVPLPVTSGELITVLVHFHRAEIGRMTGWRDRIDLTSNWAITVVAGMLSVSLSTPAAHHGVLLFAMVLVMLLLSIEARRYRFFDVYRTRVRRMERFYHARIFAPRPDARPGAGPDTDPDADQDWARLMAEDLRAPRFLISRRTAMSRRLRRNYFWMFLVLLAAWVLKISSAWLLLDAQPVDPSRPIPGIIQNLALGPLPGALVLAGVVSFYAWVIYATFRPRPKAGELAHGEVHV